MKFNETQLGVISNALRVAAERFKENAANMREDGDPRLAAQFERQDHEATELYDAIAKTSGIAN